MLLGTASGHASGIPGGTPSGGAGSPGAASPGDLVTGTVAAGVAVLVVAGLWRGGVLRLGSRVRGPALGAGAGAGGPSAWVWLLSAVGVMIAAGLGSDLAGRASAWAGAGNLGAQAAPARHAAMIWGGALCGLLAGLLAVRLSGIGAHRAGLVVRWSDLPGGLAGFAASVPALVAAMLLAPAAYVLATGRQTPALGHETLVVLRDHSGPWTWAIMLAAVTVVPATEELVFRGLLQGGLVRLLGRRWVAVLVTGVVFAALHAQALGEAPPGAVLPGLVVLGIALGVGMEWRGRLGVPVVMHAAFNAANLALAMGGARSGN